MPISQSVQPVLITPPALSETQLQQLLKQLPKSISALRAGDRVSPMAPAPVLSDLFISRIEGSGTYEPIGRNKLSTTKTFSNSSFKVVTFEKGYGQSYASFAANSPAMIQSYLLCDSTNWRVCINGEPAEGFLKIWAVNGGGPNLFQTWSVSINGGGTYRAQVYVK